MARRKYAKYMALAGAVQGVGQAALQWNDERRRQSLLEIEAQYRQQEREEDRAYRTEERAEDRDFKLKLADRDEAFRTDMEATSQASRLSELERADELKRKPNLNDPKLAKDYTGESIEAARKSGNIALLEPRKDAGSDSDAIVKTDWYLQATPKERAVYDRVNKISDDRGTLSAEERAKQVASLYSAFAKLPKYERRDRLKSMGLDEDAMEGRALENAVIDYYRDAVDFIAPPSTGISLLDDNPGQQGASRDNPLSVGPNDPPPPSGTWVRLPDGRVGQVP
jgi:hypothetical protein